MKMTDARHAAISAALQRDHSNFNAIAKEVQCTWRAVRDVWEGRVAGKRAVRDVVVEEEDIRRSVRSEEEAKRQAEAAKVRDEILEQGRTTREESTALLDDLRRERADLEALKLDLDDRARLLREARIEHGRADGDKVHDREIILLDGLLTFQLACLSVVGNALTPQGVTNLAAAIKRDSTNPTIGGKDATALLQKMAAYVKPFSEAAKMNLEARRLLEGRPSSYTSTTVRMEPATLEVLEAGNREVNRLLDQLRPPAQLDDAEVEAAPELQASEAERNGGFTHVPPAVTEDRQVPATTETDAQDEGEGVLHVAPPGGDPPSTGQ
jgi:hypothetical protein